MRCLPLMLTLGLAACGGRPEVPHAVPEVATYSIAAFDEKTGDLGIAVQSKVFGVGVVVPWVRADVGAVATQALANPRYGPEGLDLLDDGLSAEDVVARLTQADGGRERRQLGVVDCRGRAAAFTGKRTFAWAGHRVGEGYCCQGNILAGKAVVDAMAETFEDAGGALAERLVSALEAGQEAGGDKRGRQSAALLVARRHGGYLGANDRYVDIRVDDHPTPVAELRRLLEKRRTFGRDARVPRRVAGLVREPREGKASARAVFLRWMRLRRVRNWEAVHALAQKQYRADHTVPELEKTESDTRSPQARAARATYLGTQLDAQHAKLYFDDARRAEPVMVLLVKEDGRWCIVP